MQICKKHLQLNYNTKICWFHMLFTCLSPWHDITLAFFLSIKKASLLFFQILSKFLKWRCIWPTKNLPLLSIAIFCQLWDRQKSKDIFNGHTGQQFKTVRLISKWNFIRKEIITCNWYRDLYLSSYLAD